MYAPVGLLFEGASLLPQLVEKGRSQVSLARMVGRFAIRHRRAEATKVVGKLQNQAAGLLELVASALPATGAPASGAPGSPSHPEGPAAPSARTAAAPTARAATRQPNPATLAIPDYDGLSASQVVNRLAGLSPAELTAVRRYETGHRGRKTILSKVAQLQGT